MWSELERHLDEFASAVVTGVDADGHPFSVRCRPEAVAGEQVLRVALPDHVPIRPGPASLLCHSHDERLFRLKSFAVRGRLEKTPRDWAFHPRQLLPGLGLGGTLRMLRAITAARRRARHYLASRGLARPGIGWASLNAAKGQAGRRAP